VVNHNQEVRMEIDREDFREKSRETWDRMAEGWEDRNEWMIDVAGVVNEWIVGRADPQPGQAFLDIAAGPGDLGFRVAERVGDTGRLLCTDFAPEMVDVARRLGGARGLGNVEYRVLDAERMDLEDDSVDGVVCRWGYMLMADPAAALRETRRVLRDGGRLAFAVWGPPERNPWAAAPAMALVQRGQMQPPQPGTPGIFALADPDRVSELVTAAGFEEPEQEEIPFDFRYSDFDEVWDTLVRLAGPLADAIGSAPDEEMQETRTAIMESMEPYRKDDGSYLAPAVSCGVLAR
jgi:ubiquinone/menaquinone biosynthesis C-methylase UbiE